MYVYIYIYIVLQTWKGTIYFTELAERVEYGKHDETYRLYYSSMVYYNIPPILYNTSILDYRTYYFDI